MAVDLEYSDLISGYQPGGNFVIAGIERNPGRCFFVDSAAAGAANDTVSGRSPKKPFVTLGYAFSSDVLASGDVVYVMPGHVENLAAAGAVTADIAGVRVVGIGDGATRPTFNFTTTDATFLVTAASVRVENILTVANTAVDVVAGIVVTGADFTGVDIEGREDGATKQFVDWLGIGTGGARAKLIRPKFIGAAGDAGQSGIQVTAAVAEVYIEDPWVVGTLAAGCIETTAANTHMIIKGSVTRNLHSTQDGGIVLNSGTTGQIINPVTQSATNDADGFNLAFVGAAAAWFNPLVVNLAGERGGAPLTASAAA